MDFTVLVTKWNPGKEKVWETIGESKLIIYSWYRMILDLAESKSGTLATLSISYERPNSFWSILLSYVFADLYCIWCLRKMLNDASHSLQHKLSTSMQHTDQGTDLMGNKKQMAGYYYICRNNYVIKFTEDVDEGSAALVCGDIFLILNKT